MKKKHIINVKPFKSKKDLNDFLEELSKTKHSKRNLLIFKIGIFTGLRISDILAMKKEDVVNKSQTVIIEKKTKKRRIIYFNNFLSDIIDYLNYLESENIDSEYLFPAPRNYGTHLAEHQYYKILKKTAENLDFDFVGTHTMRKTFARFYYLQTKDISTLMTILNHSSQKITLNYIDVSEDMIKKSLISFNPFL